MVRRSAGHQLLLDGFLVLERLNAKTDSLSQRQASRILVIATVSDIWPDQPQPLGSPWKANTPVQPASFFALQIQSIRFS
jgi:hypothetical protein